MKVTVFTRENRLRHFNRVGPFAYRMRRASACMVRAQRMEHEGAPPLDVALMQNMSLIYQREAWQYYGHLAPCSFSGSHPVGSTLKPYTHG